MSVYRVRHVTRYVYEAPVVHAHHHCHLRPRQFDWQGVAKHDLDVVPSAAVRRSVDYFGNQIHVLEVASDHEVLDVVSSSVVEVAPRPEVPPAGGLAWDEVARRFRSVGAPLSALEFAFDSPLVRAHPLLAAYAEPVFPAGRPIVEAVRQFCRKIFDEFQYETRVTDVSTPLGQVLRERRGVCQDFAHVAIGCLRSLGLAARYVSGYLETLPPAGKPRLVGADASHAWASVFVPGYGWLDFDPTNDVLPGVRHVTVAWGRDFSDVSPLKGVVLGGGTHRVTVSVDVEPVDVA